MLYCEHSIKLNWTHSFTWCINISVTQVICKKSLHLEPLDCPDNNNYNNITLEYNGTNECQYHGKGTAVNKGGHWGGYQTV